MSVDDLVLIALRMTRSFGIQMYLHEVNGRSLAVPPHHIMGKAPSVWVAQCDGAYWPGVWLRVVDQWCKHQKIVDTIM